MMMMMMVTRRPARRLLLAGLAGGGAAALALLLARVPALRALLRATFFALRSSKSLRNITLGATALSLLANALRRVGVGAAPDGTLASSRGSLFSFRGMFLTFWGLYYYFRVRESPVVRFQRTFFNTFIVEKAQLTKMPFNPCPWAFNRHAQTGALLVLSSLEWLWQTNLDWARERVPARDGFGNELHLDWAVWHGEHTRGDDDDAAEGPAGDRGRRFAAGTAPSVRGSSLGPDEEEEADAVGSPIVLLVHGLGDDVHHPYMRRAARAFHRVGWRVCAYSYWRADWYDTRDLQEVVAHLARRFPSSPLVCVGWSAGGHLLMRLLQDVGKDTPLVAAISVSGCFDLPRVIANVMASDNPTYRLFLSQQLKVCFRRHMDNDRRFKKTNTLHTASPKPKQPPVYDRERIEAFVLRGFGSPLEMYDRFRFALSGSRLKDWTLRGPQTAAHYQPIAMEKVQVTTLVIHADDDPIVHGRQTDWGRMLRNKHIICLHTKRGGHVAHFDQTFPIGDTYTDRVNVSFISAVLESHAYTRFVVNVVRNSLREMPDLTQSMSSGNLARIVSKSDLRSLLPGGGGAGAPGSSLSRALR